MEEQQYVSFEEIVPSAEYTEEIITEEEADQQTQIVIKEEEIVHVQNDESDGGQMVEIKDEFNGQETYVETTTEETIISGEEIPTQEQQTYYAEEAVIVDTTPNAHHGPNVIVEEAQHDDHVIYEEIAPDIVQEEVILSSNGQHVNGCDFYVTDSSNDDDVIQLKEEEIIDTPSAETEMSVAMDLANLSQGHFPGIQQQQQQVDLHQQQQQQSVYVDQQEYHHEEYVSSTAGAMDCPSENNSGMSNNAVPFSNGGAASTTPIVMHPSCGENKPRLSYAQMIAEALMQADDRMLTLSAIYAYINQKYPYYRMETKSWQNAIRHNLTLNPAFKKVPRPNNEGRGNFWKMEEGSEKTIFRRALKTHHYVRNGSTGSVSKADKALNAAVASIKSTNNKSSSNATTTSHVMPSPPSPILIAASSSSPSTPVTTTQQRPKIISIAPPQNGMTPTRTQIIKVIKPGGGTASSPFTTGRNNIQTVQLANGSKATTFTLNKNFAMPSNAGKIVFISVPQQTQNA